APWPSFSADALRTRRNGSVHVPMPHRRARSDHRCVTDERSTTMSNDDLEHRVAEELHWDPRVDPSAVAVGAHDGEITLRGTVGSFGEKRDARKAAERVHGVTHVQNDLEVRLLNGVRRDDTDLRGSVLQALLLDSLIPSTIDARVDDGWVTLTGTT